MTEEQKMIYSIGSDAIAGAVDFIATKDPQIGSFLMAINTAGIFRNGLLRKGIAPTPEILKETEEFLTKIEALVDEYSRNLDKFGQIYGAPKLNT